MPIQVECWVFFILSFRVEETGYPLLHLVVFFLLMRLPSSSLVLTQSLFASHDEPIIYVSSGLMIQTKNPSSDPDKVLIDLRQWISGSYSWVCMPPRFGQERLVARCKYGRLSVWKVDGDAWPGSLTSGIERMGDRPAAAGQTMIDYLLVGGRQVAAKFGRLTIIYILPSTSVEWGY